MALSIKYPEVLAVWGVSGICHATFYDMDRNFFTLLAHMHQYDGYGYVAIKIAEALKALAFGVPAVNSINMTVGEEVNGRSSDSLPETYTVRGTAVALCVPLWWHSIKADTFMGYTMFEATQLPQAWARIVNEQANALLVPSLWSETVFRNSGVTVPIEVVPFGVDTVNDYPLLTREREAGEPYTFLWSGTPDLRKGWDLAYKAFKAAFGRRDDVRLILHFRKMPEGVRFRDYNVEMVAGRLPLPEMHDLLKKADCFVFPSRGEGWGLPPREAAATGLPVIATDWSGLSANINEWGIPLAVSGSQTAAYGLWHEGEIGEWAIPDTDHLTTLMQTAVSEREGWAKKGLESAIWLAKHATWERTAQGLMAAVALYHEGERELC